MSNEMLQKTIDLVSSLEVKTETQQIAKYELIEYTERLHKENQELKKQLDELQTLYNNMFKCHCNRVQVETLLSQQKEFIEWLERRLFLLRDEASELALGMCSTNYQDTKIEVYKEVLSKYKEIIGDKDE